MPPALLHNLKHNQMLHERILLTTVQTRDIPYVADAERIELTDLGSGFYRLSSTTASWRRPTCPRRWHGASSIGLKLNMMTTSFFLSREIIVPSLQPGMALWREQLFTLWR